MFQTFNKSLVLAPHPHPLQIVSYGMKKYTMF